MLDGYSYIDPDYSYTDPKTGVLRNLAGVDDDAALMLLHLSGITQWEFYRTLLPLLKKEPLKHRLREFSVVKIKGECV